MDLHLRRMGQRLRVPEGFVEPRALQARLDRLARGPMPEHLAALLDEQRVGLGIAEEAVIVVRRAGVRVRLVDREVDDEELALAWARGLARSVAEPLARAARRGEDAVVTEQIAVFATRAAAVQRALGERLAGSEPAWWWASALGLQPGEVPTVVDLAQELAHEDPAGLPTRLLAVLGTRPASSATLARGPVAQGLRALVAGRATTQWTWGAPAEGEAPEPSLVASAATRLAGVAGPLLLLADRELAALLGTLAVVAEVPAARPLPVLVEAVVRAATGAQRDLPAWQRRPFAQDTVPAGITAEAPVAAASDGEVEPPVRSAPIPKAEAPAEAPERGEGPRPGVQQQPASFPLPVRAPDEEPDAAYLVDEIPAVVPARREPVQQEVATLCAGLLFMLRPLARSPLVQEHSGLGLHDRLLTLGRLALLRVLAPLPEGARRAALEGERPVLGAFCGLDDFSEDLLAQPPPRARHRAGRRRARCPRRAGARGPPAGSPRAARRLR